MKRLVTWLPIVVVVGLAVAYLARPRAAELVGETEFRRPAQPAFERVALPFGSASLAGRVVDERDAPVAELPVYVRSGDVAQWAWTDADGRFAFERLLDGELEVYALAFGRPTQRFRARPGPDEVTLRLSPPRAPVARLSDVARSDLRGSLVRALGLPGEGCEVLLEPTQPPDVLQGAVPVRAAVGADGRFELAGLAHGRYRVRVLPAWAHGGSWPDLAAGSEELVHDGASSTLALSLRDAALAGRVERDDGSPLAGALILVHPAGDDSHPWPASASGADGAFRVADLPAGRYAVEIRAGEDFESLADVEVRAGELAELAPVRLAVRSDAPHDESRP